MQFHSRLKKNTAGQVMFAAIFVFVIISTLAISFHVRSQNAQSSAHRFQASEVSQQLAESAISEAFQYVYKTSEKSGEQWFDVIKNRDGSIDCSKSSLASKDSKGKLIPVPLTLDIAKNMGLGAKFDIVVKGRIIDFRNKDSSSRGLYYGKEGIGTLELKVRVTPKDSYKKVIQSSCIITRHHDYKVVCVVSKRNLNRSKYVQNFILDYAFLIRDGYQEFLDRKGENLNPRLQSLKINTQDTGYVYVGGTRNSPVFIDIDENRKDFIPNQTKIQTITATHDQCLKIMPTFYPTLCAEMKADVKAKGYKYKWTKIYGLEGKFGYKRYPPTDEAMAKLSAKDKKELSQARNIAWTEKQPISPDSSLAFKPGINIEPIDSLKDLLQGNLRKRFFHFGYFMLDTTNATIKVRAGKRKYGKTRWKTSTVSMNDTKIKDTFANRKMPCFHDGLKALDSNPGPIDLTYLNANFTDKDIACVMNFDLPYVKTGTPTLKTPMFYNFRNGTMSIMENKTGIDGFVPFSHVNLWARRNMTQSMAEDYLIYDKKNHVLNLRGTVYLNNYLTLGADGQEIKIKGQGVIIANGIKINAKLTKDSNDDICILATRGHLITVTTDKTIQASLISIGGDNKNGGVIATKKLDLEGAFAVDRLLISKWATNVKHSIKYDKALQPSTDQYQINLSRWVSFERMSEKD